MARATSRQGNSSPAAGCMRLEHGNAKRDSCIIGVIMRSSFPGRRFSCLDEVLLALFLSAPISLHAQTASSPQSQPAQSPSPPTQSQPQSMPPCSDGRPILKRGAQPALPPCPDPPPDAFGESRPSVDRKGQRGGVRVFKEASELYLRGSHVAVYPARPREGDVPGCGFG